MRTVVRTRKTRSGYWDSPENYKKLLQEGWEVVMCNALEMIWNTF